MRWKEIKKGQPMRAALLLAGSHLYYGLVQGVMLVWPKLWWFGLSM